MAKQTKGHTPARESSNNPGALQKALFYRGIAMLNKLEKTMTSPSPSEHDKLQKAMITYVGFFTLGSVQCSNKERHTAALMFALEPLSEDDAVRAYAETCLNAAERATLPGRRKPKPMA